MNKHYSNFRDSGAILYYLRTDEIDMIYSDKNMVELRGRIKQWVEKYANE